MTTFRAGRAHSLVKVLPGAVDPLRLFAALSEDGTADQAFLLESADAHQRNAVLSLGCARPVLLLEGRDRDWSLRALEPRGRGLLKAFRPGLAELCDLWEEGADAPVFGAEGGQQDDSDAGDGAAGVSVLGAEGDRQGGSASADVTGDGPAVISGHLPAPRHGIEERLRLREPGPMDLLRVLQGAFPLSGATGFPPGGLFGAFAYDFVDCFESLPPNSEDDLDAAADYHFVLADRLFLIDHVHDRSVLVATLRGESAEPASCPGFHEAQDWIRASAETASRAPDLPPLPSPPDLRAEEVVCDLDDAAFASVVEDMKEHILAGDVFQIVPSRGFSAPLREAPLTVYRRLRELNPSPYMFYVRMGGRTLLGASPETALRVSAPEPDGTRRVEIRPIAGTKPRGLFGGAIDHDLDARYEAELKLDAKELAEHVMLVDLARNDIARVSRPASRRADALFEVEKYSHVQHLVSRISGELEADLDPLHAYLATMNMGTLTGAPKVEAMRLLRQAERRRRGFYGGAVGYYSLDGSFDTAIVIRSLLLSGSRATARAGAGVVFDSVPEREADETRHKARAPLTALGLRPERGDDVAGSESRPQAAPESGNSMARPPDAPESGNSETGGGDA